MPSRVQSVQEFPLEPAPAIGAELPNLSFTPSTTADPRRGSSSLVLHTKAIRPSLLARSDSLHLDANASTSAPADKPKRKSSKDIVSSSSQGSSEADMDALMIAGMTGGSMHSGADDNRLPSLSVVHLDENNNNNTQSVASVSIDRRVEAQLKPPNAASQPSYGLSERTTFVTPQYQMSLPNERFPVKLHVYDLSGGIIGKHSKELTGIEEEGIYHSAIVCYGVEFYFEGGIGMASPGRSRFGAKFDVIQLGTTAKSLPQFLKWSKAREEAAYQLHDYHPVRHNCHHYSEEAAQFLLDTTEDVIPAKLFTTTEKLVKTDTGAPALEAMLMTTFGIQLALARMLRSRTLGRQISQDMLFSASAACGVLSLPPPAVIAFRVANPIVCRTALLQITPFITRVYQANAEKRSDGLKLVGEVVSRLLDGSSTLLETHCKGFTDLIAQCLLHTPLSFWGPLLDALRIAILHNTILLTVAYHQDMVPLILNGCRDFPRLQPDGRLGLLRVLCNMSCTGLAMAVLVDPRYQGGIVATVGLGLLDANPMVVYTAACLASNLSLAIVATPSPSLQREMVQMGDTHPVLRLLTVLLYNLCNRAELFDESSRTMLITATLRVMSSNMTALQFTVTAPFRLKYIRLLRLCSTSESRSCLCIMKTLEDLFA